MTEEKKEIKIEVPTDLVEKIEKLSDFLNKIKKKEVISKDKVEEMLKILDEIKQRLPKLEVDLEKIMKALEGTGSEVKLTFNELKLDGEISLKIIPLVKEKKKEE
ncbi:hypothetical protein ACPB8Q_00855 [Methanocaldococcus indicus]|uniref:hypothetical protein n=1 Tax=Methanocaldococcus indicus TaxID=213231 RepID=UPI003C6D456C